MNNKLRSQLIARISEIEGLTSEERSSLLGLLRESKTYGLVWEDKPEDVEEKLKTQLPILLEVKDKAILSTNSNSPNHLIIEGDNLEALSSLAYTHSNQFDVIYIDPPYNTGKKDEFKYNDRYVDGEDEYRHSEWLSFMYRRLKIAKRLLAPNGILFISIDDNEIAQLKAICDELFTHSSNPKNNNCLGVLVWDLGTGTQAGHFTRAHEYILAYTKDKQLLPNFCGGSGVIDHSALKKISKKNPPVRFHFKAGTEFLAPDNTELIGEWGESETTKLISGRMVAFGGKLKYDVVLEAGFAMVSQMKSWFNNEFTIDSKGQHVLSFYFNSTGVLHYKKERSIINPPSVLKGLGSTKQGSNELADILSKSDTFGYPKPSSLIKFLLNLKGDKAKILDFFAGSGTTLHATMQLNSDGGHRQCILVTNNENNICEEVTYERNKRVIQGYTTPKGEKVKGLSNNNLRYYRTSFISRVRSMQNMRKLVTLSTDMLCIKEDIYQEQKQFGKLMVKENLFRYFDDGTKKMLVIYREEMIEGLVPIIESMELSEPLKVYVFSPSEDPWEEMFESVSEKVELCALPQAIYNTYQRVLPKKKDIDVYVNGEMAEE